MEGTAKTVFYFGYGSNLRNKFFEMRLRDGEWVDDWHKDGELKGPKPVDMGVYVLPGYKFGYTFNAGKDGSAANIMESPNDQVIGVLYKITELQLKELDETEDVPEEYRRVALKVYRLGSEILCNNSEQIKDSIEAFVYIAQPNYIIENVDPPPKYARILMKGAMEHNMPEKYIEEYIKVKTPALT